MIRHKFFWAEEKTLKTWRPADVTSKILETVLLQALLFLSNSICLIWNFYVVKLHGNLTKVYLLSPNKSDNDDLFHFIILQKSFISQPTKFVENSPKILP